MKKAILFGALAALTASSAFANEPTSTTTASDPGAKFKSLDTNGDGYISQSEASAHPELNSAFTGAVSDASKGMTQQEFDAWQAKQGQTPPSQ